MMTTNRDYTNLYFWLGVFSLLLFVSYFIYTYVTIDHGLEKIEISNQDAAQFAANLYFTKLEQIGQISLAIIGALWLFSVGKESSIELKSKYHLGLFAVTNTFLLMSFASYLIGNDFLTKLIFFHFSLDLDAPIVKFWSRLQLSSFIAGLTFMLITLVLCKKQ